MQWVAELPSLFPSVVLMVAVFVLLVVRFDTILAYFQQEEYDNGRFLGALWRVGLFDLRASVAIVAGLAAQALFGAVGFFQIVVAVALVAIALIERGYRFKKPLVKTERLIRIQRLAFGLVVPIAALTLWHDVFAAIAIQAVPVAAILANMALAPFQQRINQGFIDEAKTKLNRLDPVRIGITGSFGKTTTKHILADCLRTTGPVFYSPGSINTVLGITRHIRQRLQWSHKTAIFEMGAYGVGSIKRLCDFVEPTYGIVTAVGDAHTERFGDVETIALAKSELVEEVCKRGGKAVINADVLRFEPFRKLKAAHPDQVIAVGDGADADCVVKEAALVDGAWRITLELGAAFERDAVVYDVALLGEHNVMNSALSVALTALIDPSAVDRLSIALRDIEQIPHRLQKIERFGEPLILDDAFNSNEHGFTNAVSVLKELAEQRGGRAILVTPGIAELGVEHDRVHERLGRLCRERCDDVVVVNGERIPSFIQAMDGGAAAVHEAPNLSEARRIVGRLSSEKDVVLYENDLPDVLEETRLL